MKKHTITFLARLSLLLAGCNTNGGPTVPSVNPPASQDVPSGQTSQEPKPSENPTQPKPSETKPTVNPSASTAPTPSESTDDKDKWGADTISKRKQYLGGEVLPYLFLGKNRVCEWVRPEYGSGKAYLEISGSAQYNDSLANSFRSLYRADGYAVVGTERKTATNEDKHLTVTLSSRDSEDMTAVIKAYYDEPYDKSKFTSWNAEITAAFNTYFDNHAGLIPLIYLGSCNPNFSYTPTAKRRTIKGPSWDDRILTDALATLTAAGWDTTGSTEKKITASYSASDGCGFVLTLTDNGYSYSSKQPVLEIVWTEGFNASAASSWPTEVQQALSDSLDGHIPPFVYLGTKNPTAEYHSYLGVLDVTGGTWDDQIIALRKSAYASWSIVEDNTETTGKTVILSFSNTFDDGCTVKAELRKTYSEIPYIYYYYDEKFDPTASTAWSSEVTDIFRDDRNGDTIPFVYLGKKDPEVKFNDYDTKSLVITGGAWKDQIFALADSAFLADGWTKDEVIASGEKGGPSVTYHKVFPNGDFIQVKIYANSDGKALLNASYLNTKGEKDWTSETKAQRDTVLDNHSVPYFYRGSSSKITTTAAGSQLVLKADYSEKAKQRCFNYFSSVFKADGWTVNEDVDTDYGDDDYNDYVYTYTATKTFTDGCILTAVFEAEEYGDWGPGKLTISIDVPYDPSKGKGWTDEVKTAMRNSLGGHDEVPYFYLGFPEAGVLNSTSSSLTLKGAKWDDRRLTQFQNAFAAKDNYKVTIDASSCTGTAVGKRTSGVSGTLSASISKGTDGYAQVAFGFSESYNAQNRSDYNAETKTLIQTIFGNNNLPAVYLGTINPTVTIGTFTDKTNDNYIELTGVRWDDNRIGDNRTILAAAGFTTEIIKENADFSHYWGTDYGVALQGYKRLGDKPSDGRIRYRITRNFSDKLDSKAQCRFFYDAPFTDPAVPAAGTSWSETNASNRSAKLGGTVVPYFYAGDEVEVSTYSNVSITGTVKNTHLSGVVAYNARKAFEAKGAVLSDADYAYKPGSACYYRDWKAADGHNIGIKIYTDNTSSSWSGTYGKLYVTLQYQDGTFDPTSATDWTDSAKNNRTKGIGRVLPFRYLGKKGQFVGVDSSKENTITATGGVFDKQVFALAEAALKKDTITWTVVSDYESLLFASATDEEGNTYYLTLTKKADSFYHNYKPELTVTKVPKPAPSSDVKA